MPEMIYHGGQGFNVRPAPKDTDAAKTYGNAADDVARADAEAKKIVEESELGSKNAVGTIGPGGIRYTEPKGLDQHAKRGSEGAVAQRPLEAGLTRNRSDEARDRMTSERFAGTRKGFRRFAKGPHGVRELREGEALLPGEVEMIA